MICVSCVHQVDSWHGFKNTCDASQKKLSSWLQRTNPEVFSKNEAENEEHSHTASMGRSGTPDVIALSSDDEEVIVIQPHKTVGARRITKGSLNRSKKLSVDPHEIDPLPVDDDSQNEQSSHHEVPEDQADLADSVPEDQADLAHSVPEDQADLADSVDGLAKTDETSDNILPDSDASTIHDKLPTTSEDPQSKTDDTKDLEPKDVVCNGVEESSEMSQDGSSMDVDIPDLAVQNEVSQDNSSIHEKTADPLAIENERQDSPLSDQDCSNWSQSDGVSETHIEGITPLNVPVEVRSEKEDAPAEVDSSGDKQDEVVPPNENHVENGDDADENPEEVLPAGKPEDPKVSDKPEENSVDNRSSIMIGEVTSLTSQAEVVRNKVQDQQQDSVPAGGKDWDRQSQEDTDSRDVIPDMVLCEAPMVANIKEEPMSAEEEEGSEDEAMDEEDPLNFHSVMIKREPDDWLPESGEEPDVKPDVALINEAIDYTPKRLKCGKLHCEPCRVSFNNDVYYERHTKSIRHKLNYRLMRNGQGPTKKRGKSLTDTILGKSVDVPRVEGRFYCNVCPKSFKHSRNLNTHQKTHLVKRVFPPEADRPEEYGSRETSDLETSSQVSQGSTSSSKPPQRQSALKLDFRHYNESNDRKCDLCDQVFTNYAALVSHKRFCGRSINHRCKLCQQSFTTTSLFFKHRKTCYQFYRKQVPRTDTFYKVKKVQKPVNIPQPAPSPVSLDGSVLACTLCNLTFHSSPDLISHMQQNHMDFGKPNSPAPAEVPNFTKPNASYRSNTSWFHYCKFCPRSFETIGALTSHTGYHARKSIYCCKFCHKKNFKDKITFRQHMKLHIADPNLKRNVCWICYTPFSSPAVLAEHKSVHENLKVKIFSCDTCGNSYNTKELLYKHKKVAHQTPGIFDGDPVGHLVMREDIMPHEPKIQLIDEDNKLFKCKICKKKFTTVGNLKRHSIKHRRPPPGVVGGGIFGLDRPLQHRCNWCFKAFKTMSGLLNHKPICNRVKTIANVNNTVGVGSTKPLKCKGCNKWFASQNSLYKHKVLKRCRGPAFVSEPEPMVSHLRSQNCPNCDQEFLSEESLNCHKKHCKPSLDKLTCDCGEVFASVELKLTHAESCPSNCTCKTCNLKFNSPEELDSHKQVCEPSLQMERLPPPPPLTPKPGIILQNRSPPVQCQKCKKPFVYMKKLQTHEEKCLNDRWPCSTCGQCFPTENSLCNHRANKSCMSSTPPMVQQMRVAEVSSDGFMFNCQYCLARFTSGGELNLHILTCGVRSQITPQPSYKKTKKSDIPESALYSCNLCDKTFIWKANVARHQKVVHKIDTPMESSFDGLYKSESPSHMSVEQEAKTFQCEFCPGIIFHKQQGFVEHQKMHAKLNQDVQNWEGRSSGESGVLLTCELCDKKLPEALYPVHMDEHMNDDLEESQAEQQQQPTAGNAGVEVFPCDVCGKEFFTAISRKSHRAMHYRNGDLLSTSPKKVTPKTHIFDRKTKRKVRYIRCTTCNKMLSINSMPKHKMMHVREAAEFYGENESASPSKSAPVQNLPRCLTPNSVSDIPFSLEKSEDGMMTVFPCPKCEKTFKLRKSLMDHLKSQHDESFETESSTSSTQGPADQFPYKCLYCDLSWKHKSVYERHLNSKKHLEIQQQLSGII